MIKPESKQVQDVRHSREADFAILNRLGFVRVHSVNAPVQVQVSATPTVWHT